MTPSAPMPKAPPAPLAPPDEEFWDRYNPHHEFPLSGVGSIALHVGVLALLAGLLLLAYRTTISDKSPVPMTTQMVMGDGSGADGKGGGGGEDKPPENILTPPTLPSRPVPEAVVQQVEKDVKPFLPKVADSESLRPEDLPAVKRLQELNDDLRKKLLAGMNGNKGKGPGDGSNNTGVEGPGASNKGDASSSSNRSVRWELIFKTENGGDFLRQLAAMKATLVLPQPADWKKNKAYRDIAVGKGSGEDFDIDKMPGLHFVDDSADSAGRLARAMGLDFSPPYFIAFFPKEIEEELAAKEKAYRGRKESEIFSTKFKIIPRNGKPSIAVVDQISVKK